MDNKHRLYVKTIVRPQNYPVLDTELIDGVYVVVDPDRRETGQGEGEHERE